MDGLGERLRGARTKKGKSAADVAAKLGVAERTVQRWEADRNEPSMSHIDELAREYGTTTDALIRGERSSRAA